MFRDFGSVARRKRTGDDHLREPPFRVLPGLRGTSGVMGNKFKSVKICGIADCAVESRQALRPC